MLAGCVGKRSSTSLRDLVLSIHSIALHPISGEWYKSGTESKVWARSPYRRSFRRVHLPCPGNRTSQNVQPLTGWRVMLTAAADGLSKRLPLSTSAPDETSAK